MIPSAPPDMWRVELFHPSLVHFPIAFLLLATLLECLAPFFRQERKKFLRASCFMLLVLGTIGAWAAVFSGEQAESIVNRVICDPTVTEDHRLWGYVLSWLFSAITILAALRHRNITQQFISAIIIAACLIGSGLIWYVGHLGGKLVYQQGAAVYHPSPLCTEFAE
jgi:uncharacterized membrane protein